MGLLTWMTDRLSARRQDASRTADTVQVANVRAYQAPMIQQVLLDGGVACSVVEEHAAATWEPMCRISVDSADAASAERLLADFHAR